MYIKKRQGDLQWEWEVRLCALSPPVDYGYGLGLHHKQGHDTENKEELPQPCVVCDS